MKSSTPSASRSSRQQGAQAHRLNRNEYENTVRDLLAIDTPMHGFDTVAEGLRFSQLQIEKYLETADTALERRGEFARAVGNQKPRFTPNLMKC